MSDNTIINKIVDRFKTNGWYDLMKGFLISEDFENIISTLQQQVEYKKRFTPTLKNIFKAFDLCPPDQVKLVILHDEPYNRLGVADGMAFSCSNNTVPEPELRILLDNINQNVYAGKKTKSSDINLERWAKQGVLLLNYSLTAQIDKKDKHYLIWDKFSKYLIDALVSRKPDTVWLITGTYVKKEVIDIIDSEYIFIYSLSDKYPVFTIINHLLVKQGKQPVIW